MFCVCLDGSPESSKERKAVEFLMYVQRHREIVSPVSLDIWRDDNYNRTKLGLPNLTKQLRLANRNHE